MKRTHVAVLMVLAGPVRRACRATLGRAGNVSSGARSRGFSRMSFERNATC